MEIPSSKYAILILILLSLFVYSISASRARPMPRRSTEFIRHSCRETAYPRLCFSSLAIHASQIQMSPQLLAGTALNVTLSSAKTTSNAIMKLSSSHGLKPREASAMRDCVDELSEALDELSMSIGEMSRLKGNPNNFKLMINDIQTWVSAALTDENTCTDGFEGRAMDGKLKVVVRGRIVNVARLTSNALALINKYALIHG